MLKQLLELRKAVSQKENGTQKALYLLCEILIDIEKRLSKLETPFGNDMPRIKTPKRKDGTPKEWKTIGYLPDGKPVEGWD